MTVPPETTRPWNQLAIASILDKMASSTKFAGKRKKYPADTTPTQIKEIALII